MTQVSDVMTRGVRTTSPKDTVMMAAQAMQEPLARSQASGAPSGGATH